MRGDELFYTKRLNEVLLADVVTWQNRIVSYGTAKASTFKANPLNWRKHPARQDKALRGSLDTLGWVNVCIVNSRSGLTIDGHERIESALRNNDAEVPYILVDLSPEEEAQALLSLDAIAALAQTDAGKVDELLRMVETDNQDVTQFLADLAKESGLEYGQPPEDAPEPQIDRAAELQVKWQTATGQLWEIGQHRLICGDCTDKAVVDRGMGGDKAEMVWTDPPYGVAVGDKNKYLNTIAPSNRVEENLENDTLDEPGLVNMLCQSFDNVIAYCAAGAAWYVAAPPGPLHVLFGQVLKDRGIWRQTIQWVKNNSTFSPMGVCYHWQAEPIFFGWLPNAGHRWYGGRTQTTVWNIDRPTKSPEHPTMKPVELVERAIENSSLKGEIVADMFVGSGTTLIACERLSRKCRAIEISPAYVAVSLQRLADMGLEPRLIE